MTNGNGWGEIIPPKCVNCIHHKKLKSGTDYCDHTEYLDNIGCPVPYPYFFKQEYPCKGHKERSENGK
jgi:hypothetical protein